MKKNIIILLLVVLLSLPLFSSTVTHSFVGSYYFHFNKKGETAVWFYEGDDNNNRQTFFQFSSSDNSTASLEVGIHYQIYESNSKVNVIFSNAAYGDMTVNGFMLTLLNSDGTYSNSGLNFNVEVIESDEGAPVVENNAITISGDSNQPMAIGNRTMPLLSFVKNESNSNHIGNLKLKLTLNSPSESGFMEGQYIGNIYVEYVTNN